MVATARIADAPQIFNRICQVASMCMCPPTASRSIHPFLRGSHVDHAYVTTSAAIIRIPCDGGYQFTIIMCYKEIRISLQDKSTSLWNFAPKLLT